MKKDTARNLFETVTLVIAITLGLLLVSILIDGVYKSCHAGNLTKLQMQMAAKIYTSTPDSMERMFALQDYVDTLTDREISRIQTVVISCMRDAESGSAAQRFFIDFAKVLLDEQIDRF